MPGIPFTSQPLVFGVGGLDLYHSVDQIPPTKLARMTNVVRGAIGEITSRPGETSVLTYGGGAALHHSITRLSDPQSSTYIRLIGTSEGATNSLVYGTTGVATLIETGWSGNPLTFVPYRPPLSGQTWMFVADSSKMRKVALTGTSLQIGLPAPTAFAVLPTPATPQTTTIDTCEAAGWTNNTGTGAGAPSNAVDAVNFKAGTASVQFTTNAPAASYYQFWNKANALNLALVGTLPASDDDVIHIWLRMDRPDLITEVRLYFVVSSAFSTATLPGTSTTLNTEAYMKAFRPSDFTSVNEASATTIPTSSTANSNLQTLQQLAGITDDRGGATEIVVQATDASRAASDQVIGGRGAWTEFGSIGIALFRSDFRRIGSDTTRTWADVTGLVISASATAGAPTNVNIWIDDIYMIGGYGPDTTRVGTQAYDYRFTNYDPRTGAEGNPSVIVDEDDWINTRRGAIEVTPNTYGDANIRQRVYRRGGTLTNNWYFIGTNTADGAALTDTLSDASIIAAPTLQIDNDQPVTTVDSLGNTVLAQPLPALWGPVQDILFGCGDPYRPGYVYWCKSGKPDSWPSANFVEVCSPSEDLQAGCVWGSQSFVFSRERMFSLIPNLTSPGTVTGIPTPCTHGLVNRWALAVGQTGIYFASDDGIYVTTGGQEENISDADLHGLFHGETRNGYPPIDFTQPDRIRLTFHNSELWFTYFGVGDSASTRRTLVFDTLYNIWRAASYAASIATVYSETIPAAAASLLGGSVNLSTTYQLATPTVASDAGSAISASFRTGALDQGFPRQDKLYGDLVFDVDRQGATITITPLINNEATSLAPVSITTGSGRTRYNLSPFGTEPQQARNLSLDVSWSSSTAQPRIYSAGISYIVQPDTTVARVTDWSVEGRPTDKWVKGLILECDTGGSTKTVELQADGATQTTVSVTANGRRVLQFPAAGSTWAEFRGRLLRIVPTDTADWKLYKYEWIFDEEPYQLLRWETQEINHGLSVHHALLAGNISIRSTADVTLTITGIWQTGSTFSDAYTITSTAGAKLKPFVPFNARKAVLWKYLFTSAAAFWLYREESEVIVQPWGGQPTVVKPFGSDDLDRVRSMSSAAAVAAADGGGP